MPSRPNSDIPPDQLTIPLDELIKHGSLYQLTPFATQVWSNVEQIKTTVPGLVLRATSLNKKRLGALHFKEKRELKEEYKKVSKLVLELTGLVANFENELRRVWQAHEAVTNGLPNANDRRSLGFEFRERVEATLTRDKAMRRLSSLLILTHILPIYLSIGDYVVTELAYNKIFPAGDYVKSGVIWFKAGSPIQLLSEAVRTLTARAEMMMKEALNVQTKGHSAASTLRYAVSELQLQCLEAAQVRTIDQAMYTMEFSIFGAEQKDIVRFLNTALENLRSLKLSPEASILWQLSGHPSNLHRLKNVYAFNETTPDVIAKLNELHEAVLCLLDWAPLYEHVDAYWLLPFFIEIATYCRGTVITVFDELLAGFYIDQQIQNDRACAEFKSGLGRNIKAHKMNEGTGKLEWLTWRTRLQMLFPKLSQKKTIEGQAPNMKISAPCLEFELENNDFPPAATPQRFFPAASPSIKGNARVLDYARVLNQGSKLALNDPEREITLQNIYDYYAVLLHREAPSSTTTTCVGPVVMPQKGKFSGFRTLAKKLKSLGARLFGLTKKTAHIDEEIALETIPRNSTEHHDRTSWSIMMTPSNEGIETSGTHSNAETNEGLLNSQKKRQSTIFRMTEINQERETESLPPYDPALQQKILIAYNCRRKYRECLTILMQMTVETQNVFEASLALDRPGALFKNIECNWGQLEREREHRRNEWYREELNKLSPLIKNTPVMKLREEQIVFPKFRKENKPPIEALRKREVTAPTPVGNNLASPLPKDSGTTTHPQASVVPSNKKDTQSPTITRKAKAETVNKPTPLTRRKLKTPRTPWTMNIAYGSSSEAGPSLHQFAYEGNSIPHLPFPIANAPIHQESNGISVPPPAHVATMPRHSSTIQESNGISAPPPAPVETMPHCSPTIHSGEENRGIFAPPPTPTTASVATQPHRTPEADISVCSNCGCNNA